MSVDLVIDPQDSVEERIKTLMSSEKISASEYDSEYTEYFKKFRPNDDNISMIWARLKPFFPFLYLDDAITEICVNRPNEVFVERDGQWVRYEIDFSYKEAIDLGIAVAAYNANEFKETLPSLSSVLPNRERVQFVMPPACEDGTVSMTIRKPSKRIIEMDEYEKSGFFANIVPVSNSISAIDEEMLDLLQKKQYIEFVKAAILNKKNILVAGATGSGKTTFMKGMMQLINTEQRIITIEDTPELFLPKHPNHIHLFYPSEQKAETVITPASLLKACLRMKPDRILLAELRGGETWDFIQVCSSGHGGSISSLHAGNVREVFERLCGMYMSNPKGQSTPKDVIMETLFLTIDVVIHMHNDTEHGHGRGITEIWFDPHKKINSEL